MISNKLQVESDMESVHVPVLLHEIISAFAECPSINDESPMESHWYIDGTLGGAGHAMALANKFTEITGNKLNVIGFDRDETAIVRAQGLLKEKTGKLILECENYRNLGKVVDTNVDFILLDLGISSDELDRSGRGFTFLKEEPLLMTMGDPDKYPFTAKDIVNRWKEDDIANVIFGYGEDRYARRIARAIVNYREKKQIETTTELAEIVKNAVPRQFRTFGNLTAIRQRKNIHPATKTFQALRIAVNDELGALKEGLVTGFDRLKMGGRMAIISFHSLEDRIVKEFFKDKKDAGEAIILTKKPVTAIPQEVAENPRSRSAKLRIIQKIK